jgi:hypothetical protein
MALVQVDQIAAIVQPFADFYADSKALVIVATAMHIGGLLAGGGLAIASDRAILRTDRNDGAAERRLLQQVATTHTIVITALAFIVTSGLMFLAADVRTFISSPVYWFKMSVVAVLLLNGARLRKTEQRLNASAALLEPEAPLETRGWNTLRTCAVTSIVAWFTILVCGTVLANI